MCMQRPDWFIAAAQGNVDGVRVHAKKMIRSTDKRETSLEHGIFQGFAAIHYAAYFG